MGILAEPAEFVRRLNLQKGFSVLELGDQYVTHGTRELARDWYKRLGCGRYVSLDGNGRGTHTWDLNKPCKLKLGTFHLVTDFGTGEHVFDQAQVWRTLHAYCKMKGWIAFSHPSAGYDANGGHGFYNINECLYRDLAAANGYAVVNLEHHDTTRGKVWHGVFRKLGIGKFANPQQGRYHKILRPIAA